MEELHDEYASMEKIKISLGQAGWDKLEQNNVAEDISFYFVLWLCWIFFPTTPSGHHTPVLFNVIIHLLTCN